MISDFWVGLKVHENRLLHTYTTTNNSKKGFELGEKIGYG